MTNSSLRRGKIHVSRFSVCEEWLQNESVSGILTCPSPSLCPMGHQPWKSATTQIWTMPSPPGNSTSEDQDDSKFLFDSKKRPFPLRWGNLGHKSALWKERHFNRLSWRSGETEKSKHLHVITLSAVLKLTRCWPSTSDRCQIAVVKWVSYSHYWASSASSCPAAYLSLPPPLDSG